MSAFPQARPCSLHPELSGFSLNEEAYKALLEKLISESKYVQNNPRQGCQKRRRFCCLDVLAPFSINDGPLEVEVLEYVKETNLKSPMKTRKKPLALLVLIWTYSKPRKLGRGPFHCQWRRPIVRKATTVLVVALLTILMANLGKETQVEEDNCCFVYRRRRWRRCRVDMCVKKGAIENLKNGPVFWVD